MKILGEAIFAKDAAGAPASRIGTIFFKTPGLVTKKGVHAMQRAMWLEEVNSMRAARGLPAMTEEEEDEELALSVDLIFTEDLVLIRPDPARMDLALRADEELQKLVSKTRIRFLNTHSAKVRNALCARGENWRMARSPVSQEDMAATVRKSKAALSGAEIYYYNSATGTRWATPQTLEAIASLPPAEARAQIGEMLAMMKRRNRIGRPEVDLFPSTTPIDVKRAFEALDPDKTPDGELCGAIRRIDAEWRMSMPQELREENIANYAWRNAICQAVTQGPNDPAADDELIQGISPEFFRQIEWLPGARSRDGEVVFDSLWEEYARTKDPSLAGLCDQRARNIIFNLLRFYGDIEYVNIGRITNSLSRRPDAETRRGCVYIMQCKTAGRENPRVSMLRFQKWGVAERLDEGKDLLRAIMESGEYFDYILDRRLMCRQLGMRLPDSVGAGMLTESYTGDNRYRGTPVATAYFSRAYVPGTASDKVPPRKFRNAAYAQRFARLMGEAAAIDMAVGRASSETGENLFDCNYEVVQCGEDGLPARIAITDHAGSFTAYDKPFERLVAPYARAAARRKDFVASPGRFAEEYVEGFRRALAEAQAKYRASRAAFDSLFANRPFDAAGSGAYRWSKTLERLDGCDPDALAAMLAAEIDAQTRAAE